MDWYPWVVFTHVLGAFGFVLGHGVSAHAALRLRSEREPSRVAALLELSSLSLAMLYLSLLVLLAAGIAAGFMGGHWARLWIWVALGLLIVLIVFMYAVASPYYVELRRGIGLQAYGAKDATPPEPMGPDELAQRLASPRPIWLAVVGGLGLAAIIWLMVVKPF